MTKVDKLRLCGWLLVVATALILASSIQLEVTGGCCNLFVWLHVILGCLFFAVNRMRQFEPWKYYLFGRQTCKKSSPQANKCLCMMV